MSCGYEFYVEIKSECFKIKVRKICFEILISTTLFQHQPSSGFNLLCLFWTKLFMVVLSSSALLGPVLATLNQIFRCEYVYCAVSRLLVCVVLLFLDLFSHWWLFWWFFSFVPLSFRSKCKNCSCVNHLFAVVVLSRVLVNITGIRGFLFHFFF